MDFTSKKRNALPEYIAYASEMRGGIINTIADMERMMDTYIAEYFCQSVDKRTELMEIIISTKHLTFQAKADIIQCILEKRKDSTKSEAKKIKTALVNKIANQRNIIAHCSLDISVAFVKEFEKNRDKVYFIKYKDGKHTVSFGKEEKIELIELVSSVKAILMEGIWKSVEAKKEEAKKSKLK